VPSSGSGFAARRVPAYAQALTPTPNPNLHDASNPADPEAQRIQDELSRLRDDAGARSAFYDELRRTVERVRAGLPDEDSKNPPPPRAVWHRFHDASGEPRNTPATEESREPSPAKADETAPPKANESPPTKRDESSPSKPDEPSVGAGRVRGSRSAHAALDRAAYLRVVRNAKANGAPVPLALGVAWIESHLQTYPPRGAAGEVGMFQILPERCRMEGWQPKRLKEPEFNAWLATRLLARYYQEEGSWERAAAKYVAGPRVFERNYSHDMWAYINWYANSVDSYADYFSRYQS
jgi:hypothetical protein